MLLLASALHDVRWGGLKTRSIQSHLEHLESTEGLLTLRLVTYTVKLQIAEDFRHVFLSLVIYKCLSLDSLM